MYNVYALLVGIQDYPAPVTPLKGPREDAARIAQSLSNCFAPQHLKIKTLLDEEATKENIIRNFRTHLGQAEEEDVALFFFAGHGSRNTSAPELVTGGLSPEGRDETLVCYDSRSGEGKDLADKEFAVLLEEIGNKGPRIICWFDCCHAGNITRKSHHPTAPVSRFISEHTQPWALSDYLNGYFSQQESLFIPEVPHIVLSACKRNQTALEINGSGLFTQCLCLALKKLGPNIAISALHRWISIALENLAHVYGRTQQPQLEMFGANPESTLWDPDQRGEFHGRTVYFKNGEWFMDKGAIDGLRLDQILAGRISGTEIPVRLKEVGPEIVKLDVVADQLEQVEVDWEGVFTLEPVKISIEKEYWNLCEGILPVRNTPTIAADLIFEEMEGKWRWRNGKSPLGGQFPLPSAASLDDSIAAIVKKAGRWKNGLMMAGTGDFFPEIRFGFFDPAMEEFFPETRTWLKLTQPEFKKNLQIRAQNNGAHPLYFTLVCFQSDLEIVAMPPVPAPAHSEEIILFGANPEHFVYLPKTIPHNTTWLRLIVSDHKPDWFLLGQSAGHSNDEPTRFQTSKGLQIGNWHCLDLILELVESNA